jgi:Flp pilus assembly protein TadG
VTRRAPAWALIEFALGLPLLLGVMLGSVAIGRVLWCERAVQSLASDAARVGALGSSPMDASSRASARAGELAADAGLDPGRLQVAVDTSGFGRGGWVVVQARYQVVPLGPDASNQDGPWWVGGQARERVDRYRSGVRGS